MHYTFHQLKVFIKVVEHQSVTKAAEDLHLTQPAVSIQLKKLQDQFDIPLTEVVGRQLFITDFGMEIAMRSKRILEEAERIKFTANQYKGLITGRIKISVVSTGKYVMPYFLKPFMDLYPGIEISLDVSNKNKVVQALIENVSDFSLVSVLPEGVDINKVGLMENQLYLAGSSSFKEEIKHPSDLSKHTLLFREEGSATRMAMETYLKKHKIEVVNSMELVSNEAVKQAIQAGIGISIVPLIGLRSAISHKDIQLFSMKGLPIVTNWNLIYAKAKNLTPAMEVFVSFLKENKKQIIERNFHWVVGAGK